jgi:hypothetical protein
MECFLNGEFVVEYVAGDEGYIKDEHQSSVSDLTVENITILNGFSEDDQEILDEPKIKDIENIIKEHFYYIDEVDESIKLTDEGQEKIEKTITKG